MKEEATNGAISSAQSFPPALVTETLQYRLVTGNIAKQGGQRGSLTRCAQKFGTFQSKLLLASDTDAEAIETSKQELVQELQIYQLELSKLVLQLDTLQQQVQINETAESERQAQMETLSAQVLESQMQADRSQQTRKCYLEYEALAKLANDNHPQPSHQLEQKIDSVQKEIQQLEQDQATTDQQVQLRESQFQLLMQYMLDLKRSLNDKDESIQKPNSSGKDHDDEGAIEEEEPVAMQVDEEDGLYGDL